MAAQHGGAGPVGMVGLGNMGGRITRRMVDAGHEVRGVDRVAARIPASGAKPAPSLAELAAACDVIMLSLPDSSVTESAVTLAATAEVMVAGKKAGLDLARLLDVINTSSGVSFASLNRFPHIIKGDYLEGGLTGWLMAKDLRLYLGLAEDLGVPSLVGPGTLTAFQVSNALGYGDVISNRVVDALGDLAGGVRVSGQTADEKED
jgi:3-hydroxyisobutyrate dehydrogenase-like beta-hydroxyacid dehydrogenase